METGKMEEVIFQFTVLLPNMCYLKHNLFKCWFTIHGGLTFHSNGSSTESKTFFSSSEKNVLHKYGRSVLIASGQWMMHAKS